MWNAAPRTKWGLEMCLFSHIPLLVLASSFSICLPFSGSFSSQITGLRCVTQRPQALCQRLAQRPIVLPLCGAISHHMMPRNPTHKGIRIAFHQCLLEHRQVNLDLPIWCLGLVVQDVEPCLGIDHQVVPPMTGPHLPVREIEILVQNLRQCCTYKISMFTRRCSHGDFCAHRAAHYSLNLGAQGLHHSAVCLALQDLSISETNHQTSLAESARLGSISRVTGGYHDEVAPVLQPFHHLHCWLHCPVDHLVEPFQRHPSFSCCKLLYMRNSKKKVIPSLTGHPVQLPNERRHLHLLIRSVRRVVLVPVIVVDLHLLQAGGILVHGILKLEGLRVLPLPPSAELGPSFSRRPQLAKVQLLVHFLPDLITGLVTAVSRVIHVNACYATSHLHDRPQTPLATNPTPSSRSPPRCPCRTGTTGGVILVGQSLLWSCAWDLVDTPVPAWSGCSCPHNLGSPWGSSRKLLVLQAKVALAKRHWTHPHTLPPNHIAPQSSWSGCGPTEPLTAPMSGTCPCRGPCVRPRSSGLSAQPRPSWNHPCWSRWTLNSKSS